MDLALLTEPNASCLSFVAKPRLTFFFHVDQGPVVLGAKGSGMPEIPNQSFAVADTATGFQDMDGILGTSMFYLLSII